MAQLPRACVQTEGTKSDAQKVMCVLDYTYNPRTGEVQTVESLGS